MAVVLNAANEYLRYAAPFNNASDYTWMAWVRFAQNNTWQGILSVSVGEGNNQYETLEATPDGNLELYSSSGAVSSQTVTYSTNTWYHLTMVRSGTTLTCYIDGVPSLTVSGAGINLSAGDLLWGHWSLTSDPLNGRISYSRAWTAALTSTEILTERLATSAVRTADLWGDWPLQTAVTDISGNGRNLTTNGTITWDTSTEPISAGISGIVNRTLAGVSPSSNSTILLQGNATPTLGSLQSISTGELESTSNAGTSNSTLQTISGDLQATIRIQGSVTAILSEAISTPNGSLRFFGNGTNRIDRVVIPLENGVSTQYPINVGAGSFTYDVWIRCNYADNTTAATDARYSNIVLDRDSWGEQRGHVVLGVTRSGSNLVACFGQAGSGGSWNTIRSSSNIGDGSWHHIAITRNISDGSVTIWVDGIPEASATYDTTDWSFPAGHVVGLGQDNEYLVIGTEKHDVGFGYNGQLDELRISNTVRYSTEFTPTRRFEPDEFSVGLYHADASAGTQLVDDSTVSGAPTMGSLLVGGSPAGPVWIPLPSIERSAGATTNAVLGTLTSSAAARIRIQAAAVPTLGTLTNSAATRILIKATVVSVLNTLQQVSTGEAKIAASVVQVLVSADIAAVGNASLQGTTSSTLQALVAATQATLKLAGAVETSLSPVGASSSGVVQLQAALEIILAEISPSIASGISLTASAALPLSSLVVASTGAVGEVPRLGALSQSLQDLGVGGSSSLQLRAAATGQLAAVSAESSSNLRLVSIASLLLESLAGQVAGRLLIAGNLAVGLDSVIIQSAGLPGWIPASALLESLLEEISAGATGRLLIDGNGSAVLETLSALIDGELPIWATAEVQLQSLAIAADNLASAVVWIAITVTGPATGSHEGLAASTHSPIFGPG